MSLLQVKFPDDIKLIELLTSGSLTSEMSVETHVNVLPLYDRTLDGIPRLTVKCLNSLRNVVAVMSSMRSRWTALVELH